MTSQQPQPIRSAQDETSPLIVRHPDPDLIRMTGADRIDFLDRISTNQIAGIAAGAVTPTVFTTPLGRVVDSTLVIVEADSLTLLVSPGRSEALLEWLRKHIFFQDDVSCEESKGFHSMWGVYGQGSLEQVQRLLPAVRELSPGEFAQGTDGLCWRVDRPVGGYQLLLGGQAHDQARIHWPASPESSAVFEALRIESGLPMWGKEITEEAIPLEVGLWEAVSFSKGCYVGQEIIARMESRGKQAKQLVGIQLSGPASAGAQVRQGEARVGSLTSVAHSPRLGWIGLGVVKPAALTANGGAVEIGEDRLIAHLTSLPFESAPTS